MTPAPLRTYLVAWAALMLALGAQLGTAFVPLGWGNIAIHVGVSALMAFVVGVFFMHLRGGPALLRLVAALALFMLAVLFGLSSADFATRTIAPAGWSAR